MSSTHDLEGNINFALKEAEFLIFLASPASANSKWVQKEIEYWVENKSIDKLIIVLTDGEITWVDESKTFRDSTLNSLPGILQKNFLGEPFYVDLRQIKTTKDTSLHNPIFKKEVLKLAAPLHNKQPKDLAGEEVIAHRKMMRVRNGAIGALALLLIAALIAGFIANENRKQAIESRNQAVQNANEAKRQENIAITQKDSANQARAYAVKQESIAQLAKDTAIMERDNAIHQREIAIEQKKQAMANFLVSEARNLVNINPTLALRLLEQSMRYHNNNSIKQAALNIYFNNNFYKSVNDSAISQLRLNQSISNTKLYLHPSNPVPSGNELPYFADSANQKKVDIKTSLQI